MLICDKRRPARARGYQYQAPPRGPNKDSPPGLRPAPRALLGRGLAPPDPLGCAPWRAFAHRAPAASVIQPEGFRARVRRWRGWATACGCPCPTPSPWRFPGFGGNFKKAPQGREAGRGLGGRAPPGSGAVGNRVEPVGGQGATRSVVPAVHGRPRLSTAERAMGNSGLNNLIGQTFFKLLPKPLRTRSSIEFQKNYCIKKHVIQIAQRCAI